jgi:hypothetical protein
MQTIGVEQFNRRVNLFFCTFSASDFVNQRDHFLTCQLASLLRVFDLGPGDFSSLKSPITLRVTMKADDVSYIVVAEASIAVPE